MCSNHGMQAELPPMAPEPRAPVSLPRFATVRKGGYHPLEVDRWVASVTRRLHQASTAADVAEARAEQAVESARQAHAAAGLLDSRVLEAERRAQVAEQQLQEALQQRAHAEQQLASATRRGSSERLEHALRTVLDEAGKATDAVLAEARARAVALVEVAERETGRVTADAALQGEISVMRRRQEVDAALAERIQEQERIAGEIEVLRQAQRLAAGSARSVLDQLGAVAASLEPADARPDGIVIDLTEGSEADSISAAGGGTPAGTGSPGDGVDRLSG